MAMYFLLTGSARQEEEEEEKGFFWMAKPNKWKKLVLLGEIENKETYLHGEQIWKHLLQLFQL